MARSLDLDELVEHWTLLDDERELIAGKRGPTRLGFALLLKFYTRAGRFPRGRGELPDEAVQFVARQVRVEPSEVGFYEWSGSTIAYHRAQIRAHLGFRECTVADAAGRRGPSRTRSRIDTPSRSSRPRRSRTATHDHHTEWP